MSLRPLKDMVLHKATEIRLLRDMANLAHKVMAILLHVGHTDILNNSLMAMFEVPATCNPEPLRWVPVVQVMVLLPTEFPVVHRKPCITARACQIMHGQLMHSIQTLPLCRTLNNTAQVHGLTLDHSTHTHKFRWAGEMPLCDGMMVNGT